MTTYTAYFRTDAEYAVALIEADTPEQALALAREDPSFRPPDLTDFATTAVRKSSAVRCPETAFRWR
jgi:hypothetical protein